MHGDLWMRRRTAACQRHGVGVDISVHIQPWLSTIACVGSDDWWCLGSSVDQDGQATSECLGCLSDANPRSRSTSRASHAPAAALLSRHKDSPASCGYIPTYRNCLSVRMHNRPIPCPRLPPPHRACPAAPEGRPCSSQPSARWHHKPSLHGSPKFGFDCVSYP
ncbi:hypothetical protein AOQ84DRAFT_21697 [Glonium stellatum]|uniref:Uncharacterized protein n=1 Tax=Glonium stellatum TaxID=574774 RepID=A0A8E2F3J8_9PEZI|nr:hypothetical protein AOQ84DRAFT_21697 [Glonium stellatum]